MTTHNHNRLLAWFKRASFCLLITTSGCGVFFHTTPTQRPFNPTTSNSDLVIVRTSDQQYYYIVDTKRSLCFFHAKMYGRTHLVSLPCEDIPEYEEIMGLAPTNDAAQPSAKEYGRETSEKPTTMPIAPKAVSRTPPAEQAPPIEDQQMKKVEAAFMELQCNRRKGHIEPLETLLERHALSLETWEDAMNALQSTPKRWSKLHDDAAKECTP